MVLRPVHWIYVGIIIIWCMLAYIPALRAGFIYDDAPHILHSPTLTHSWESLVYVWIRPAWTPQYYPLTHTLWWMQYQLWGFSPLGYHLVNILGHIGVSVLLWKVLVNLQIDVRIAFLTAAVFALHPVHVESVAYVSELKNIVSALWYFMSGLYYLKFHYQLNDEDSTLRVKRWMAILYYSLSLLMYVAALLSKTVTASLPVAMALVLWWKDGRIRRCHMIALFPFVVLGMALGLTTAWLERHQIGTAAFPDEFGFTVAERFLIAGRATCFYAQKLLWPGDLTINYIRWTVDTLIWQHWLYLLAVVGVIGSLWVARRWIGRGPLVSCLYFVITLAPALGFVDVYPFRFSFVADHYQYLASIGVIIIISSACVWVYDHGTTAVRRMAPAMVVIWLVCLSAATWRHCGVFRDNKTLWMHAVERNPASWVGHLNLAGIFTEEGDFQVARDYAERAIRIRPELAECHSQYVIILAMQGEEDAAIEYINHMEEANIVSDALRVMRVMVLLEARQFDKALEYSKQAVRDAQDKDRIQWIEGAALLALGRVQEAEAQLRHSVRSAPLRAEGHQYLAKVLLALGRSDEAIESLRTAARILPHNVQLQSQLSDMFWSRGKYRDAIEHLAYAVEAAPENAVLRITFGERLISAGAKWRGVRQLRRAIGLAPNNAEAWHRLAVALAGVNRRTDAIAASQRAMELLDANDTDQLSRSIAQLRAELGAPMGKSAAPASSR